MRQICTPEQPYTTARAEAQPRARWAHQEAYEVEGSQEDGYPSGDTVRMRCDTCGVEWTCELAQ